jgi:hypothetical protein
VLARMTTAARRSACSHAGLRFTAPAAGVYTVRATSYEIAANTNDTIDPNADGDNTLTIVGRGVGIEELERRTYASYVWSLPVMSTRDVAEAIQSFTRLVRCGTVPCCCESRPEPPTETGTIARGPVVHVDQPRPFVEHVVVEREGLDVVGGHHDVAVDDRGGRRSAGRRRRR